MTPVGHICMHQFGYYTGNVFLCLLNQEYKSTVSLIEEQKVPTGYIAMGPTPHVSVNDSPSTTNSNVWGHYAT